MRASTSGGPNSFNFMQFLGKFGEIVCWHRGPPWRVGAPPRGNPGSANGDGGGRNFSLDTSL